MDAKGLNLDGLSLVRQLPEPPGLYIRSRREDKAPLFELLASGATNMSGIVFGPARVRPLRSPRGEHGRQEFVEFRSLERLTHE